MVSNISLPTRGEEEDLIIGVICVSENEDFKEDVDFTESVVLNLNNEYPSDREILLSDVKDPMRRAIIEHGPCRSQFSSAFAKDDGKTNFIPSYYTHRVGNIEVLRQWLCYSPSLNKPYWKTCLLFAERKNNINRTWINGVSGDTHNMITKSQKHEKCEQHIAASRNYGRWKSGKTIDEERKWR